MGRKVQERSKRQERDLVGNVDAEREEEGEEKEEERRRRSSRWCRSRLISTFFDLERRVDSFDERGRLSLPPDLA